MTRILGVRQSLAISALSKAKELTRSELMTKTGMSLAEINEVISSLVQRDLIQAREQGGFFYSLKRREEAA